MSNSRDKLDSRVDQKRLVVWTCPEKHPCMSGFLPPMASTLQFCRAVTGWDGEHETYCGAKMQVCYDERPKPEGPLTEDASDDEKRIRVADGIREAQKNLREGEMMASEIVAQLGVALKGIRAGGKKS